MTYPPTPIQFARITLLAPLLALAACPGDPQSTTDPATDTTSPSDTTVDPSTSTASTDTPTGPLTEPDPTTASTTHNTSTSSTTDTSTTDTTTINTTIDTTTDTTTGDPIWTPPQCKSVTGTGAVTFSFDQGATLAPMDQAIVPVTYTFGLVALGKPGAMLAGSKQEILASADAGCSWHAIGDTPASNAPAMTLRAAGDTRAYGFGDNDAALIRVDDELLTILESPAGQDGIVGLGVDPNDPDHLRIGDSTGRLWDSADAGATWMPTGSPAINGSLAYRIAFDPQDIDHVLVGAVIQGVVASFDGGAQWTTATGLGSGKFNAFNLVVSPAQGDIAWVEGIDIDDPNEATARHIYRSDDGGLTFLPVVDADQATLYNGNHMFPHPTDPAVLYFVFGSNYANYGTDLFRYDHTSDTIDLTHNKWHDTILAFSPGDPSVIYLGLSIEPGGG